MDRPTDGSLTKLSPQPLHDNGGQPPKLAELSTPRQALVRLCQSIDYGWIEGLHIRDREPVFDPPPVVILDVKLDTTADGRREVELLDFALRDEVCRLLKRLDHIENGRLDRIEVRAGIPRRVLIEAMFSEAQR
jgi:hypothetical protein